MCEKEELITKALKRVNLIAIPFFVVMPVLFMLLAINLYSSSASRPPAPDDRLLLYMLAGESVIISGMALFLFRKLPPFMLRHTSKRGAFSSKTGVYRKNEFVILAQNFCLMLYAFSEGSIFFGLLLFMLGFPIEIMIPFTVVGIISYLVNRPNREFLERLYDKLIEHELMKTE